jgi:hypothetical protein
LEEADTYLEVVDGERRVDTCSVWGFLVFFTWSGLSGGPILDLAGFAETLLGIRAGFEVSLFPIGLWGIFFLSGELMSVCAPSPGAMLCLGDGRFNLDGLMLSSEPRTGERDPAVDIRALEGRRSFETGCTNSSLLGGAQDDVLDGDLETLDTFDGARDGDRTGLLPLKKLDCLLAEPGDGGICASVSSVRSDKDGRTPRRPRASWADAIDAVSSSPAVELASSGTCVSFSLPWISSCLRAGIGSWCGLGGDKCCEDGFFTSVL